MQQPKIEDINKQKDEIINKRVTEGENSSLKTDRNNKNEFSDKKSCFMKHRLLIILSIIIGAILIITSLVITILVLQKKQEKIIVDIKREINQIDYYRSTKKQRIYFENVKSSNDENLRNLEEEIYENSTETTINFLTSINTYDVKKYFNGTTIYKSFIIIKELSYLNENGNDEKILSFDFDEINESNENIEEINNIPLIKVEFYRNGTIINEFIPKNLNKTFLDLLDYSKEKLIPLVSESLYNNNLRILSEDYDAMSYKKENNIVVLKREINTKVNNNGNIIKDSINEGNMETKIINGTIKNIELKSRVSLSTNDTQEENEDNVNLKLPYHKISSDVYENFTFIKSDINEKITNNLKRLITKCNLVDKNKLDEEEEIKEENNKENLEDKLRRLSSNSLFKDNYEDLTIVEKEFLGSNLRLYMRVETFLNLEKIVVTVYVDYNSRTYQLFRKEKDINIDYAQIQILNNLIAYKNQVNNFANSFLKLMNNKLISLYKEINEGTKKYDQKTFSYFEGINKFESEDLTEEELILFYEKYTKSEGEKEINSFNVSKSMNNLFNEINNLKQNINSHFTDNKLVVPNYYNPIEQFNILNKDFEKSIQTLSNEAVKYFSQNRNLRNLNDLKNLVDDLKNENNNNELLRGLVETPYINGNPFINSVLQDFDRISYEFYLLIRYLHEKVNLKSLTKNKVFSGLLSKKYSIDNVKVSEKNKEKISKIYSEINSVINTALQNYQQVNNDISNVKKQLIDIYNQTIPNVKSKTYNSMINKWKSILSNSKTHILANIDTELMNQKIFKIGIKVLGFGFNIYGNLDKLISKLKVNITFNPYDLSVSLNLQVQKSLQFSIGGSVDILLVGGGVEASLSFGDLDFQLKPTFDFYYLQNKIPLYVYYRVPQLCFKAEVYYTVPVIKCDKVWFVKICYPWVEQKHQVITNSCTSSKTSVTSRTYYYDIFDRNKINQKSTTNKNLMTSNKNWIMSYFK